MNATNLRNSNRPVFSLPRTRLWLLLGKDFLQTYDAHLRKECPLATEYADSALTGNGASMTRPGALFRFFGAGPRDVERAQPGNDRLSISCVRMPQCCSRSCDSNHLQLTRGWGSPDTNRTVSYIRMYKGIF